MQEKVTLKLNAVDIPKRGHTDGLTTALDSSPRLASVVGSTSSRALINGPSVSWPEKVMEQEKRHLEKLETIL